MQFEWSHGRRLEKASNLSYNVSYKYDDGGIRTSKTVGGTTTEFITSGIQVLAQKTGNNVLIWQIDGNGQTVGFNYNGTEYFYLKNAQGDIVGITDASGNIIAEYVYDSWGKVLSVRDAIGTEITNPSHVAHINPLRYRGYYYDSEFGLCYLNARYYDPEVGRFISADGTLAGGPNLFAYCDNNPVNYYDPDGLYDRKAAHLYAITWYNKRNPDYPYYNSGDCANFVSQCLKAGGFKMNDSWSSYLKKGFNLMFSGLNPNDKWNVSEAWRKAPTQYEYLKKSDLISGSVIINSSDEIASVANAKKDRVRIGDIMYLQFDKDVPHHATIITSVRDGMIYYNAHTDSADDKALSMFFDKYPKGKAYILKIK